MSPRKPGRSHGASVSSTGSLLQDLPSSFVHPVSRNGEEDVAFLSLSEAIHARRNEYTKPDTVRIKIGTWNVGAEKHAEEDVAKWFVDAEGVDEKLGGLNINGNGSDEAAEHSQLHKREEIGMYVLNLQEVVDVTAVSEALRPYSDPSTAKKWKDTVGQALPEGYTLIAEQQMIGLLLLVYVSPKLAQTVRGVSLTSVGTGLGGVMGNKGAVAARVVIGESTRIVFVNSHLAAGADKTALERRNWDAAQVVTRARFTPLTDIADTERGLCEQIGDEDFAFWTGDLNYRLGSIPGDDVRRLLTLHAQNRFDYDRAADADDASSKHGSRKSRKSTDSNSSSRRSTESSISASSGSPVTEATTDEDGLQPGDDPASLLTTLTSLLPHDELRQQIKARKAFHDGWKEGPITFLPTYKYDVGSFGVFDTSEKKRGPSFCDRILYRTGKDKAAYDKSVTDEKIARTKDALMKAHGADQAASDEEILYDYDPDNDGDNEEYDDNIDQAVGGDEQQDDAANDKDEYLTLENYTTYQHILSSDHKPMSAEFTLRYTAIDPVRRAQVYAEVVKKYDEAENETRPRVTIIADNQGSTHGESEDQGVNFGDIRWAQLKQRTLTIANVGSTPASFSLIARPTESGQDAGIAPNWLTIKTGHESLDIESHESGFPVLEPGDAITLILELQVLDMGLTQAVNNGTTKLNDVLVLRIKDGRDHFVSIQADWQTTCLCCSINELIRVPDGGIRKVQSLEGGSAPTKISLDLPVRVSAPREVFRLIEAIEELCTQVIAEWEMAAGSVAEAPWDDDSGWPFSERSWSTPELQRNAVLSALCDAVDSNNSIMASFTDDIPKESRLYLLCEMLLIFLRSLSDGVIPVDVSKQLNAQLAQLEKAKQKLSIDDERNAVQEILIKDGAAHNICFVLLTTMLQRIMRELQVAERSRKELSSPTEERPGTLRRMTGLVRASRQSHSEHVKDAVNGYAEIFSAAAVKAPSDPSDMSKVLTGKRRVELFRMFLNNNEPT